MKKYTKSNKFSNSSFYINSKGEKVTCISSYKIINEELTHLGINTKNLSINELINIISKRILNEFCLSKKLNQDFHNSENYNILKGLLLNVREVAYYLYDFDTAKMPDELKESYQYQYPIEIA
ncbi:MAG: hypothetical protein RL542_1651 [Bacteroidota bacterium]